MKRLILTAFLSLTAAGLAQEKGPTPRVLPSAAEQALNTAVSQIDQHFDQFWASNQIVPAPLADDAEFLRRLSLDLMGRIPSASEAREFIESKSPDKRTKKIDEYLSRPGYVQHFSTVLRQLWIPQATDDPQFIFLSPQFETWLQSRLKAEVGLDKIVRELLTAPTLFGGRRPTEAIDPTNTPFAFNQVNEFKPENVAAAASRLFMGVKIECAQCHNHPFASYKREQFWELAAFFAEVQPAIANISDVKYKREIKIPDSAKVVQAKYFDGKDPKWEESKTPRQTFTDWLTADANPYFARNAANRMWAHFLGLGIVEPIDEPSEDNPALIPEVLDLLAKGFVQAKFDQKFLIRAITRSKVYQRSSRQTHESQTEAKRFAKMNVKALSAEQLFDSLGIATGFYDPTPAQERIFRGGRRREFLTRFGSTEKLTEKQTSILQALTLMNGRFVNDQTSLDRSQFLAGVIDAPFWDSSRKVEVLFLASLGRMPTATEAQKFASYVDRGGAVGDKKKAVTDIYWALLNSSEFILNH